MYNGLNNAEKRTITNLLNEKRGRFALKYANAWTGMNFERPFMVRTLRGKFTVNDVKKSLPDSEWAAVVYFKPGTGCWRGELHAVAIRWNADRFDIERPNDACWLSWSKTPNDFNMRRSFEDARKSASGTVYIVAQLVKDLNSKPAPARKWELSRLPENERFQYIGIDCSYPTVRRIDRNGEKISVRVNGGYIYYRNEQLEKLTGKVWVDKSGYMALTRIEQRVQKAKKIRADREKEKADRYECGATEQELSARLDAIKGELVRLLNDYHGQANYGPYDLMRTYRDYFTTVKDLADHIRKVETRAYSGKPIMDMIIRNLRNNVERIEHALKEAA